MLDGTPLKVKTQLKLREIKVIPDWDGKFASYMTAEIELLPFGYDNSKGNHRMHITIPIAEDIREHLEKALMREIQTFIEKENEK